MKLTTITTTKCMRGVADITSEPAIHTNEYETVTMGCDASCSEWRLDCCVGGCAGGVFADGRKTHLL